MGYICSNPWTTAFVWGDGMVTHCCYSNIGPLGNINRESLPDIWRGKKIEYVRRKILAGKYTGAGCEYFCRVFRWNDYYGNLPSRHAIPEGLGRMEDFKPGTKTESPSILGLAIDARCNLKCTHCLSSNDAPGLTRENIRALWDHVARAKIVRLVNGEFTINTPALELLSRIASLDNPARVFLNTNGTVKPSKFLSYARGLKSFHLKYSLEGLGADYGKVRVGAEWESFGKHLMETKEAFDTAGSNGLDWKLFLNFCVMRSNFEAIPKVLQFAAERSIPLVLNTLNGLRHIDENMFMYPYLVPNADIVEKVRGECGRILQANRYGFADEFLSHLDYILRVLDDKKFDIPYPRLKRIVSRNTGRTADRKLTLLYKWKFDKKGFFLYLFRKIRKKLFKR